MSADSITQRLLCAETHLLDAISLGEAALAAFLTSWEGLKGDITRMAPQLSNETLYLVHAVSSKVALIAEEFGELETKTGALKANVEDQCEAILLQHQSAHSTKYVSTDLIAMLG
jgi:hypothetical protein